VSTGAENLPGGLSGPHGQALLNHVAAVLDSDPGVITLATLGGGQSNPTYLVSTPKPQAVLRKRPARVLAPGAHDVDREYRVLTALTDGPVPVPRPLDFCNDSEVLPEPFYLMRYVPGRVPLDSTLAELEAAERMAVYAALVDALADLHTLDWRRCGLADFGRDHGHLARLRRLWSGQFDASADTRYHGLPGQLTKWLERHAPADTPHTLVHGDVQLANLIIADNAAQIAAIVDWELSTIGDPLTDLALLLLPYAYAPHPSPVGDFEPATVAALGLPDPIELADRYSRRSGADLTRLRYVLVLMLLRTAGVLHGIVSRVAAGTASGGAGARRYQAFIEPALGRAWDIARGGPCFVHDSSEARS